MSVEKVQFWWYGVFAHIIKITLHILFKTRYILYAYSVVYKSLLFMKHAYVHSRT